MNNKQINVDAKMANVKQNIKEDMIIDCTIIDCMIIDFMIIDYI